LVPTIPDHALNAGFVCHRQVANLYAALIVNGDSDFVFGFVAQVVTDDRTGRRIVGDECFVAGVSFVIVLPPESDRCRAGEFECRPLAPSADCF
jgi:hypothetical protein